MKMSLFRNIGPHLSISQKRNKGKIQLYNLHEMCSKNGQHRRRMADVFSFAIFKSAIEIVTAIYSYIRETFCGEKVGQKMD